MAFLRNNPQAMQAVQQGMAQQGGGGFPGGDKPMPGGGGQGYGDDMVMQPMPGLGGQGPGQQLGNKPMPMGPGQDPRFANKPMPGGGAPFSASVGMMPQVSALSAGPGLGEKTMPLDPRFDPAVANKPMPAPGVTASQRAREGAQAGVTRQQGMQQDPAYQRQQNALAQAAGKPLPFGQGNPGAAEILKPGLQINPVEGPPAVKPGAETPQSPTDPVYTKPKPGAVGGGGAPGGRRPIRK